MTEGINVDRIRDIEDRIRFCEECQNLICEHLNIEIEQKAILKRTDVLGFKTDKEEK